MSAFNRRNMLGLIAACAALPFAGQVAANRAGKVLQVYRSPSCGCCGDWIAHMADAGFQIDDRMMENLAPLKAGLGVPDALQSCHTGVVDGYVLEGHVPAEDVLRLLVERPDAIGLAVPGMPVGSPGMEMDGASDAYDVIQFAASGDQTAFARH